MSSADFEARVRSVARKVADAVGRDSWLIRNLRPAYRSCLARLCAARERIRARAARPRRPPPPSIVWRLPPAFDRLLAALTLSRGLPVTINGVRFRIDPRHRHQLNPEYEFPIADFLRERVKPGAVCLDVGANVGAYVLQFAHWSRPDGRVIAFEPSPGARAALETNLRLNGLTDRVVVVPAAAGAAPGEAVFYDAGSDMMSRLGSPNPEIGEKVTPITVPVTTLDAYCEAEGVVPDWLFLDVEGFEIAALAGARELIRRCGPSLGIVVEIHPAAWPVAGTTRSDLESLLEELGRRVEALHGQAAPLEQNGLVLLAPE